MCVNEDEPFPLTRFKWNVHKLNYTEVKCGSLRTQSGHGI